MSKANVPKECGSRSTCRLRAERRLGQDAKRELDCCLHDQQVGDVGQDVFGADPDAALARRAGGQDVIERPERQRPAPLWATP